MGAKSFIRAKTYYCGGSHRSKSNYIEVDVFPMFETTGSKNRKKRRNVNPAELDPKALDKWQKQQSLNDSRSRRYCELLAMTNFTEGDFYFSPTYSDKHLPADYDEAKKKAGNFLRKLKRMAKKLGKELKYIGITEIGSVHGRYHHHFLINKNSGLSREDIESAWAYGYCNTKINRDTADCIGYLLKAGRMYKGERIYMASRNLTKPTVSCSDNKVSKAKFLELKQLPLDCHAIKEWFEKLYQGYVVTGEIYRYIPEKDQECGYREGFAYFRVKLKLK